MMKKHEETGLGFVALRSLFVVLLMPSLIIIVLLTTTVIVI